MSALHAYFAQRNQHAFRRTLEAGRTQSATSGGGGPGTSGGKSWTKSHGVNMAMSISHAPDINARDWLGRTVLHLACAATDPAAGEYVRMILAHPGVNPNLQDRESMWTALHRALYQGNLAAAILLLQRTDTDATLKDSEGYTAFDLYNSTIEHTKPSDSIQGITQLFTWGSNRNATLGLGDDKDRTHPEQVQLRPNGNQDRASLKSRLLPLAIRNMGMSKLHTVVLTDERRDNVRICGFGSGGRLGAAQNTQYSLTPVNGCGGDAVVATALGQDHTLILTKSGEVYSWGLNRFSQLGYLVEATSSGVGRSEEPVQATPKKVPNLKNQVVRGIAASKTASACWTSEHLYTWGTNTGQLGYDKAAQPVQISPRIVTKVQKPVIMVVMTENAMACLLESHDVMCFSNDRQTKINFPVETFPSEMTPYRPPQSVAILKITVCEGTFAALSTKGEVYTFAVPSYAGATPTSVSADPNAKGSIVRPQRIWSLRKKFSAATDIALGADGALAICTESGHVYVRARGLKGSISASAKGPKFLRVPGLQRVIHVSANSTGGYSALHAEYRPPLIALEGNNFREDFATVQPWLKVPENWGLGRPHATEAAKHDQNIDEADEEADDEGEDDHILQDIQHTRRLCDIIRKDKKSKSMDGERGIFAGIRLGHGADIMVQVNSAFEFPVHRLVAALRSPVLRDLLSGGRVKRDSNSKISVTFRTGIKSEVPRLIFDGCRPMAVLLLMTYFYTDDVPALWDRRVTHAVEYDLVELGVRPADVKRDLHQLARILELPRLDEALEPMGKRAPAPSLLRDVKALHDKLGSVSASDLPTPDVVIQLADRHIQAYSLVLRARSPLFAAFFDAEDWTKRRWAANGTIIVDFSHLKSRAMEFIMRFICFGEEEEMLEQLDFIQSVDELIDFLFDVMAAANELHLERFMLVCSRVMMQYINVVNVGYILSDASYYHSLTLIDRLHSYMAINMETLLEGRLLDELSPEVVKQLSSYVRSCQTMKSPIARSTKIVDNAMMWFGDWLSLQDIPEPIVSSGRTQLLRDNARVSSPISLTKTSGIEHSGSKKPQLPASVVSPSVIEDDVFVMDGVEESKHGTAVTAPTTPTKKASGTWKAVPSTPKADLKTIMAEAKDPHDLHASTSSPRNHPRQLSQVNWRAHPPPGDSPMRAGGSVQRTPSGSSPWKSSDAAPLSSGSNTIAPASPSPAARTKADGFPALGHLPSRPPPAPTARPSISGLGPFISPARQVSSSRTEGKRSMSSGGKVWSSPAQQPAAAAAKTAVGLSFADIQAIQLAQALPVEKDKRSLVEIQEEERARQEEADFLKWWAEEEARTKVEIDGLVSGAAVEKKKRKPRKSKGPKETSSAAALESTDTPLADRRPQHSRKPSQSNHPSYTSTVPSEHGTSSSGVEPSRRGGYRSRGAPRTDAGPHRPAVQAM